MIGGYYVCQTTPDRVALIAGPFATWAEADALGPAAVAHVNQHFTNTDGKAWGICEFWGPVLVSGVLNSPLWAKATPVER